MSMYFWVGQINNSPHGNCEMYSAWYQEQYSEAGTLISLVFKLLIYYSAEIFFSLFSSVIRKHLQKRMPVKTSIKLIDLNWFMLLYPATEFVLIHMFLLFSVQTPTFLTLERNNFEDVTEDGKYLFNCKNIYTLYMSELLLTFPIQAASGTLYLLCLPV